MIRRLRLKFVLMNMAFVSVLLAAVFAVVLHNTQNQLAQASLRALEQAALEHLGPVRPDRRPGEPGGIPCFVLQTGPRGELIAIGDGYYDLTDEDWLLTLLAAAQERGGPLPPTGTAARSPPEIPGRPRPPPAGRSGSGPPWSAARRSGPRRPAPDAPAARSGRTGGPGPP